MPANLLKDILTSDQPSQVEQTTKRVSRHQYGSAAVILVALVVQYQGLSARIGQIEQSQAMLMQAIIQGHTAQGEHPTAAPPEKSLASSEPGRYVGCIMDDHTNDGSIQDHVAPGADQAARESLQHNISVRKSLNDKGLRRFSVR